MNQFEKEYRRIINEYKNDNLIEQGIFDFFKKKDKDSANVKSNYCNKLWNDKNYKKLAEEIKSYKKNNKNDFSKDPNAIFYYGVLLLKDLIQENRLNLNAKSLLLESKAVQTDQEEVDVVHFDIDKKHLRKIILKAKLGNKDALYDLAIFYYVGIPDLLSQNMQKAIKLFKKAAEKGCAEAQYNLGVMYERGYDRKDKEHENQFEHYIHKDEDEAYKWYAKAVQNGYEDAKEPLKYLLNKKKLENDPKIKHISQKEYTTNISKLRKGMQYVKIAAENGCEEAKKYVNEYFGQLRDILNYFIDIDTDYKQKLSGYNKTPQIELQYNEI